MNKIKQNNEQLLPHTHKSDELNINQFEMNSVPISP